MKNKSFSATETESILSVEESSGSQVLSLSASLSLCCKELSLSDSSAGAVAAAFNATCRSRPWKKAIFHLARVLQGLRPDAPPEVYRELLRLWHQASKLEERQGDKATAVSFAECYGELRLCWEKVNMPQGAKPLAGIIRAGIGVPSEAVDYEEDVQRLAMICRDLQWNAVKRALEQSAAEQNQTVDEGEIRRAARDIAVRPEFFLSCRTAAAEMGIADHVKVWRLMNFLWAERLLERVTKATKMRATRWRWLGNL